MLPVEVNVLVTVVLAVVVNVLVEELVTVVVMLDVTFEDWNVNKERITRSLYEPKKKKLTKENTTY